MLSNKTKDGSLVWPNTTDDMEDLEEWKHGQTVYGSFAKLHSGFKNYRDDINRAWGKENDYKKNTLYVDTLKLVSEQLKR